MNVKIGNIKENRKNLELVLSFENYTDRDKLENFVEYLFRESANSLLHDCIERGSIRKKEVMLWGRSKSSLLNRVSCTAKYNNEDVKVKLVMTKEDMLDYLSRLENTKGVRIENDYRELLK